MKFPAFRQTYKYDCGAQALQCVFAYYGIDVREEKIMKMVGTNKSYGTHPEGIKKAAKEFGLKYKEGKMNIKMLKKYIDRKIPVIIAIQAWSRDEDPDWENDWKDGHYVIPIGYTKKRIYFEDPLSIFRTYLSNEELEKRWHDVGEEKIKLINWGIAFFKYEVKSPYNPNKAIHME